MKIIIGIAISIVSVASCTTAKYTVSDEFSSNALKLPVKGMNGWMMNQQLSFGNYATSPVKRSWDFSSGIRNNNFLLSPEEQVLKVFQIDRINSKARQKGHFQYTITDGENAMAVYATEKFSEKELLYTSNNPWLGDASGTIRYEYAFSAALVPVKENTTPWQLVLVNRYDASKNRERNILKRPYVEEEGYATDGKESIAISPGRMNEIAREGAGKKAVANLLAGYELRRDNKIIAIIDILDNVIWITKDQDVQTRLLLASVASAILLKRVKDAKEHETGL